MNNIFNFDKCSLRNGVHYTIGMEKSNYNIIEKGKSNPQFLTLLKICCALECEPKHFFDINSTNYLDSQKIYKPRKHDRKT